jgi:hypothetical protein
MEEILQYVWKHRLYAESDLTTTDGRSVFVIDAGLPNINAGPDFFNAKIRVGDTVWAGNVEIHSRASDWYAHGHHRDKAYDSVVLHVVGEEDALPVCRSTQEPALQAVLRIPERIRQHIDWLLSRDTSMPCAERLARIPAIYLSDWMTALASERLERKASEFLYRLEQCAKDWNEIFYVTLMRSFGFGTNSDAFEWLARSLPYKYILKHRHHPLQVEALLFGQAGLLQATDGLPAAGTEKATVPPDDSHVERTDGDPYYRALCREYAFLRKKYRLTPVEGFLFKKLRTRPVNFPHVRIAQVAALWIKSDLLFSEVLALETVDAIRSLLKASPSDYWLTHYHFGHVSPSRGKTVGKRAADALLINTVVPLLFAYGKLKEQADYCDRALRFLETLPPERNHIVTFFDRVGVFAGNAADTQALIQLRCAYCDCKKCLYCRIGFRMIDDS